MATSQKKNNNPPRGGNWSKLETAGDVRRYLRWLILATKTDKVDVRKAGVMGQLGIYLLKALETSDFEARLAELERRLERSESQQEQSYESGSSITTH